MSRLLGISIYALSVLALVSAQCYDCNYNPGTNGGFPACSLSTAAETALVSQVTCSSNRCFIRQDSNGFIYRGCGDDSHLPFGANATLQCATQAGSVWYFCTGALCNSGLFSTVCPSATTSAPVTAAPTAAPVTVATTASTSVNCYDCTFHPYSYSGYVHHQTPSACAVPSTMNGVAQTACSEGRCFIRRDANGDIYRGCANVANLPFGANVNLQCATQAGSVWYFCLGGLCNSASFSAVCPSSHSVSHNHHNHNSHHHGYSHGYSSHGYGHHHHHQHHAPSYQTHHHGHATYNSHPHYHHSHAHAHSHTHAHAYAPAPSHTHSSSSNNNIIYVSGGTYPNLANYIGLPTHGQPFVGHGSHAGLPHSPASSSGIVHVPGGVQYPNLANYVASPAHSQPVVGHGKK